MYRIKSLYDNTMEIRGFGDVVNIALPKADNISVAITANTTDVCPVAEGVTANNLKLTIKNVATFSMKFSDTEQVQSQFNMLSPKLLMLRLT